MRRHLRAVVSSGVAAVVAAACGGLGRQSGPAAPSLVGEWRQEGEAAHAPPDSAARQAFVFRRDGSALWIIGTPARPDTFAIRYQLDGAVTPARLDLFGFERGPLRGRTLYCIADLSAANRFRMDCEPGRPGGADDAEAAAAAAVRPASFTAQSVTYRRRR